MPVGDGSGQDSRTGSAFAASRVILLLCSISACAVGINSSIAKPLFGVSTEMSVWLLASYFWLLALIELSPWPFLYPSDSKIILADKVIAAGMLVALLFYVVADLKAGEMIGVLALIPVIAAMLIRMFLNMKGIALWKGRRSDAPDQPT